MQTTTKENNQSLSLEVLEVKNLMLNAEQKGHEQLAGDPALQQQAKDLVERLFSIDPRDHKTVDQAKLAVEDMGVSLQMEAAKKSTMLRSPINTLAKRGDDGGPVANALVELKVNIEALDPIKFNFEPGWFSRTMGFLPFVGKPIKKYFTKYENAETVLDAIMNSLKKGRETLKRDNITLSDDQVAMREMTIKLEKAILLAQMIDQNLSDKLSTEVPSDDPKYKFIQEELVFPLRQRIQDLQQQMAVNQQGILAVEIIIRNNKELVRGVDRCVNVTVNALQVAITVALALANQRIVLQKIQMVNETTDNLISGTAKMLRKQGTEIHKQASSTTLSMESLKQAFVDINAALDDISKYRQEVLPQMAKQILELNELTQQQEEAIQKMENGNAKAGDFAIEIN